MARESSITFEQVSTAADAIEAAGNKATSRAVREALGTGSMATVLKFLQQRIAGQARTSQAIDDTIDPSIVRAISSQIAAKVQEATAIATASLAELQAEAATIIAENERQAVDLENAAVELTSVNELLAAMTGRAQQLETDAARTAAELVQERQAAELARINLAKAELRLEAVPRIEKEIEQVRIELAAERIKSAEQHEAAAVAIAKFEAAQVAADRLAAQLAEQRTAADRTLAIAEASTVSAITEAKKSAAEAAELRGQLVSVVKQNESVSLPKKPTAKKQEVKPSV